MPGPCDSCHAGCCRSYHLFIHGFDALRLSQHLALPVGEFATLISFPESLAPQYQSEYVPLRFTDREPGIRFLLGLKRLESPLFPGSHRCLFLLEWSREHPATGRENHPGRDTVGRCGVYGSRPLVCQIYPTALHDTRPLAVINTPQPIAGKELHPVHALCGDDWTPQNFGSSPDETLHRLAIQKIERDFYNRLSEEINARGLETGEFIPFLTEAYGQRFRHTDAFKKGGTGD